MLSCNLINDDECDEGEIVSVLKSILHIQLLMPSDEWNEYLARSGLDNLDCIVELYNPHTSTRVLHSRIMAVGCAHGNFEFDLSVLQGSYELLIWAMTPENAQLSIYATEDLKAVHISDKALADLSKYSCEERMAYCCGMRIEASDEECHIDGVMHRPFARYKLYVIDGAEYQTLSEENEWPSLDRLGARIRYTGFYPTALNVWTGNANDALAGISYKLPLSWDSVDEILVGEDMVIAGTNASSLQASLELYDLETGEVVSGSSSLQIPYSQGCTTTLHGSWLCSSESQGGIGIDPTWQEVVVSF